jgi:polyribonucleotide nucleotidyltransferase
VGDVIGPAGKVIKKIIAATKAKIDVDETGKIIIASTDMEAAEKAKQMISEITVEAEIGKTYQGKVVRIEEYGAFVEILPNIVGLMHISEIAHHRIKSVRDVLNMGQIVNVKVLNIDEDNKIKLSMKALEEDTRPPQEKEQDRERESYAKKNSPYRRSDRDRRNRF